MMNLDNNLNPIVYSDLVVIFDMMSKEMLSKISPKFIKAIKEKASNEYKSEINPCIPLRKQKLNKDTEAFLAIIYKVYFNKDKKD